MVDDIDKKYETYKKQFENLSNKEINEINLQQLISDKMEHDKFLNNFYNGLCYICGSPLKTFSTTKPCLHWFLKPKGVKKSNFITVLEKYSYFQIESYLRWVANIERKFQNINNIKIEMEANKKFEKTIKYKHLEWSLYCSNSDFNGEHYKGPHYHLQIRLDHKPFINFGDFHILFKEDDLIKFKIIDHSSEEHLFAYGEGMQEIMDINKFEECLPHLKSTNHEENALLQLSSIIIANDGEKISGEIMNEVFAEAKEKNTSITSVLKKKVENKEINGKMQISYTAGKSVPEIKKRPKRKKDKKQ